MADQKNMSVKRCQSEIDSAEFAEWIVYHKMKLEAENGDDNKLSTPPGIENMLGTIYGHN